MLPQNASTVQQVVQVELARTSSGPSAAELQRAFDRLLQGVIRGACIGLTLRGGLHLVGSLLSAVSKRKDRSLTAAAAIDDTLRFTAFLGALAGIYIGVDEGISAAVGKDRSAKWRSLVAGMCAGPALLLTGPKNRHYSLATYILLRGFTLLIRTGNTPRSRTRHPWLHAVLAPTRLAHGDTLLMCGACSQIVYAFLMMPQTLPSSYVRFIKKQGAKDLFVYQAIRELAERTATGRPLGPLNSLIGTPHAHKVAPVPCHFFHPGQTCSGHVVQLMGPAYRRALSVYLPVYVLPALLVHRQQLLKQPLPILQKVLLGIGRSSLFLSSFICLAFGGACAGHAVAGRSTGPIIAASVWVGGLATLLEKKSRRMELSLYVLSRALESFSRCCIEWGWLAPRHIPPRLDILLFAAGVGAITHCYSGYNGLHRDVFKSKYLNVLDFVFGNTGITEGKIKHLPSNQDLLMSVGVRVVRSLSYGSLQKAALGRRVVSYDSLETTGPPLSPVAERSAASPSSAAAAAATGSSPVAGSNAAPTGHLADAGSSRRSISWPETARGHAPVSAVSEASGLLVGSRKVDVQLVAESSGADDVAAAATAVGDNSASITVTLEATSTVPACAEPAGNTALAAAVAEQAAESCAAVDTVSSAEAVPALAAAAAAAAAAVPAAAEAFELQEAMQQSKMKGKTKRKN